MHAKDAKILVYIVNKDHILIKSFMLFKWTHSHTHNKHRMVTPPTPWH